MRLPTKLVLAAASLLLVGQGCIQITGTPKGGNDGGVFRSADRGTTWQQKSAIATVGQARGFANLNVTTMALDPSDKRAVYAGTEEGLVYSLDGAETWHGSAALGRVRVSSIAVSPSDKCTVYVGTGNRVMRTTDCARTWENVYLDPRGDARVNSVKVDHFNAANVFAATSKGDVLKSGDGGASWAPIHRFEDEVRQMLMSAGDSRTMYAATRGKGIWKTTDGGATWADVSAGLGEFAGALDNIIMSEDVARGNSLLIASNHGLLRTVDGGATWQALTLLTPPGSTVVYSLAVSPKDSNFVAYGTINTLYRSVDGGAKWTTTKMPTTRAATTLLIDPADDKTMYMGTTLFKQNTGF